MLLVNWSFAFGCVFSHVFGGDQACEGRDFAFLLGSGMAFGSGALTVGFA
jgi:hypothetical protein